MTARRGVGRLLALWLSIAGLGAGAADLRLVQAAQRQDWARVDALLDERVDVNAARSDGQTALHWAAHWNRLDTADRLLKRGATVNAANAYGVTPLWLACENGSGAMVARLLAARADPNVTLPSGESALMTCARAGDAASVAALLSYGAHVEARETTRGQTALMWAVWQRHPEVVSVLLAHGADVHARSRSTERLVQSNRYAIEQNKAGAFVTEQGGFTPLLFAAQQGDVESARRLLAAGARVNDTAADGSSPLGIAALSGHAALAQLLLEKGADANAAGSGYTALHAAVLSGDPDSVQALLAHGADPNAALLKPTPVRAYSRDLGFSSQLIGATPLWLAAKFAEPRLMRALVAGGADPRFAMGDGTTVVMAAMAANRGEGDRRERLLSPAAKAVKDETEARLATETVTAAIELGCDVNAVNDAGNSALHLAASSGYTTVIELLAARGARLDVKNTRGQTPLALVSNSKTAEAGGGGRAARTPNADAAAAVLRRLGATD